MRNTPSGISAEIAKGVFRPHTALTNMALSYYQNAANYFARAIFSICPVGLSSDNYYIFDKEDLLRDNWQRKPAYGKVAPAVVSEHTDTYNCQVDQMIMGIDQIRQTDLQRRMGPAIRDPKQQRTKTIAEQANIHQDMLFADKFFKAGAWNDEYSGVDSTTVSGKQFIKFSNGNTKAPAAHRTALLLEQMCSMSLKTIRRFWRELNTVELLRIRLLLQKMFWQSCLE